MSNKLKEIKEEIKGHFNRKHSRNFYENYLSELGTDGERLKAVCPFCDDKTPSFKIYPDGGFKCFQCGEYGDIFDFHALLNGLSCQGSDWPKVLEGIADEFGLDIEINSKPEIDYIPQKVVTNLHNQLLGNQAKMSFLTNYRGLNPSVIKRYKLGYDGERITIPIPTRSGKYIDIRRYDHNSKAKYLPWKTFKDPEMAKKLDIEMVEKEDGSLEPKQKGSGSSVLYPIKNLEKKEILICEGELDALRAIAEGINAITNTCGVQGWQDKWNRYLRDKDVILGLDNDSAGRKETERRAKKLTNVKSLKIVAWPEGFREGGDVTGYLKGHTAKDFKDLFKVTRKGFGVIPIELQEAKKVFHKWLYMEDDTFIDVVLGTHLTTEIPGDPVWLFLVAPPGSGKTEILRALRGNPGTYSVDQMTDKTLVSGNQKEESSLAPKIHNKTFIIKDFGPILSLKYERRNQIFNDLRAAYDGYIEKEFGNQAEPVRYDTHFSLLVGCTPVIDKHASLQANLGERFLKLRIDIDTKEIRESIVRKALENVSTHATMRKELKRAIKGVLAGVDTGYEVKFDEFRSEQIGKMALFLAYCRTGVSRDRYDKTLNYIPESESGARPANQLKKLAIGISWLHGKKEVTDDILEILRKVTVASVPVKRARIIFTLIDIGTWIETSPLAEKTNIHRKTVERTLDDLTAIGLVRKRKESDRKTAPWQWKIVDRMKAYTEDAGLKYGHGNFEVGTDDEAPF